MSTPVKPVLTAAELVILLQSDAGISHDELLQLAGYQQPRATEGNIESGSITERSKLADDALKGSKRPSIKRIQSAYLRVAKIVSADTSITATSQKSSSVSVGELEESEYEWTDPGQFLPGFPNLGGTVLKSAVENYSAVFSANSKLLVRHWTDSLSRAEIPRTNPPMDHKTEAGDLLLIEDYSELTMPFWREIRAAADVLARHFGSSRLRRHQIKAMDQRTHLGRQDWPTADLGCHVLVLGSAGVGGKTYSDNIWRKAFAYWQSAGAMVHIWSPAGPGFYSWVNKAANTFTGWEPEGQYVANTTEKLLACLSTVQWCSTSLLRYWRRSLKGSVIDEAIVWNHEDVWSTPYDCGLKSNVPTHRERFSKLPAALQQQLRGAASSNLRENIADVVYVEESRIAASLGLRVDHEKMQQTESRLGINLGSDSGPSNSEMKSWLRRVAGRQDEKFWKHNPDLTELCREALMETASDAGAVDLPEEMANARKNSGDSLYLGIRGQQFIVEKNPQFMQLLYEFENCNTLGIRQQGVGGQFAQLHSGGVFNIADVNEQFVVTGKAQSIHFERLSKPDWAVRIEQTSKGLIATIEDDRRLHWCASGGDHENLLKGAPGAWIDESQVTNKSSVQFSIRSSQIMRVMNEDGIDESAVAIELEGLPNEPGIDLRWIPPGEFQMGSPDSELGRWLDEQQHPVIISCGFWMMATTCSQRLWQAVTGENPSEFKGSNRPVDSVSWEDVVEKFLPELNRLVPELYFRLPSEAEWEYACRAGTQTAFYTGDYLTTDKAQYLGNVRGVKYFLEDERTLEQIKDRYGRVNDANWAEWLGVPIEAIIAARHDDREYFKVPEGAAEVDAFEPNAWGLYQMHGNVWEWCQDSVESMEPYGAEARTDPVLTSAGQDRVIRGGSWSNPGRSLRSAMRGNDQAGSSYSNVGFRLVAGPRDRGAREAGAAERLAGNEAERNGRKARSSDGTG